MVATREDLKEYVAGFEDRQRGHEDPRNAALEVGSGRNIFTPLMLLNRSMLILAC